METLVTTVNQIPPTDINIRRKDLSIKHLTVFSEISAKKMAAKAEEQNGESLLPEPV